MSTLGDLHERIGELAQIDPVHEGGGLTARSTPPSTTGRSSTCRS